MFKRTPLVLTYGYLSVSFPAPLKPVMSLVNSGDCSSRRLSSFTPAISNHSDILSLTDSPCSNVYKFSSEPSFLIYVIGFGPESIDESK